MSKLKTPLKCVNRWVIILWLARMNNFNTRLMCAECKPTCFKSSANQQNKKLIKQHKHKGSLKYIIQVLRLQLVNHDYNQTSSFQTSQAKGQVFCLLSLWDITIFLLGHHHNLQTTTSSITNPWQRFHMGRKQNNILPSNTGHIIVKVLKDTTIREEQENM